MFFLGPAFVELKNQTAKELLSFLNTIKYRNEPFTEADLQQFVYNSSRIPREDENIDRITFLTKLASDHTNNLFHLLIVDEAHWGIRDGSLIIKFLSRLYHHLNDLERRRIRPCLLIVKVSATIDVITKVVDRYIHANPESDPPRQVVDWAFLSQSDSKFRVPTYLPIKKLIFTNDVILAQERTQADRSSLLENAYFEVFDRAFNRLSTSDGTTDFSYWHDKLDMELTKTAAESLLPISQALYYASNYDNRTGNMVLIRFARTENAKNLDQKLRNAFKSRSNARGSFQPFEIVLLHGDSAPISSQLTSKVNGKLDVTLSLTIEDLHPIPVLVLVVDKLAMGERLAKSCSFFDIRARYSGEATEITQAESTFVQDVGRCAGHNKEPATIFMALQQHRRKSDMTRDSFGFRTLHHTLTSARAPLRNVHPEHENCTRIFTKLSEFTIVLDAEPQIGKTGAFLSLLWIILDEQVKHCEHYLSLSKCRVITLSSWLCTLANENGAASLETFMSDEGRFSEYHQLLFEHHVERPGDTNAILWTYLNNYLAHLGRNPVTIADCGCGLYGIARTVANLYSRSSVQRARTPLHVTGIDFNRRIHEIPAYVEEKTNGVIKFIPVIGEMGSVEFTDGRLFDAIVFNCSFFENRINRYLQWSARYLGENGVLGVVNLISRFPTSFGVTMSAAGWNLIDHTENNPYAYYIFERGQGGTSTDYETEVILNSYNTRED
jgi:hypothetical protein